MGRITADGPRDAFAEHGLYERRRAAGLGAAAAPLIAMIEDRGWPRPGWAAAMVAVHEREAAAAIGGVVEHGGHGPLRWALFFSDFGRYQSAMPPGPAEYLSDVNICYKREPLESVRPLWQDIYQESTVNWALRRAGHDLRLSPEPEVVETRAEVHLLPVMRERMHWARIFAHVRGRETPSRLRRLAWAVVTPVLPSVLFLRHVRRQLSLGRYRWELVKASPALLLVLHCWAFGECIGYCEAALEPSRD